MRNTIIFIALCNLSILFSCKTKVSQIIDVSRIQDEIGKYSDYDYYRFSCIYKDSLFNIVITNSQLYNCLFDSLFYLSDSSAIGSSYISRWNVDKQYPIELNAKGYQYFSKYSINDSIVSELRNRNLEELLEMNCTHKQQSNGNLEYVFPFINELTREWFYVLMDKGYEIFLDCETGYFVVFHKQD